jgi:hypothetical protein
LCSSGLHNIKGHKEQNVDTHTLNHHAENRCAGKVADDKYVHLHAVHSHAVLSWAERCYTGGYRKRYIVEAEDPRAHVTARHAAYNTTTGTVWQDMRPTSATAEIESALT